MFLKKIAVAGAVALMGTSALAGGHAGCPDSGRISIVGNEFPAIQTVGAGAVACASDSGIDFQKYSTPGDLLALAGDPGKGKPAAKDTQLDIVSQCIVEKIRSP